MKKRLEITIEAKTSYDSMQGMKAVASKLAMDWESECIEADTTGIDEHVNIRVMQEDIVEEQDEYLRNGGNVCPNCGSKDIEGESLQSDCAMVWQKVSCMVCEATWTDQYKLLSFDTLEVPK